MKKSSSKKKKASSTNKASVRKRGPRPPQGKDGLRVRDLQSRKMSPKVGFARDALLHALKTMVHRSGLLVVDTMLVLHEGPSKPSPLGSFDRPMQIGTTPFWLEVVPKPPGGLPGPDGEVPIPRDTVVGVYRADKLVHFFTWPPEDLLPECASEPDAVSPREGFMPLKKLLWSFYNAEEVREEDVGSYRRFHERVRAAIVSEIASPGAKRPLIDIVYDVAGGPQLEAMMKSGAPLSRNTLLNMLAGQAPS